MEQIDKCIPRHSPIIIATHSSKTSATKIFLISFPYLVKSMQTGRISCYEIHARTEFQTMLFNTITVKNPIYQPKIHNYLINQSLAFHTKTKQLISRKSLRLNFLIVKGLILFSRLSFS